MKPGRKRPRPRNAEKLIFNRNFSQSYDDHARVDEVAGLMNVTASQVIRDALKLYLETALWLARTSDLKIRGATLREATHSLLQPNDEVPA